MLPGGAGRNRTQNGSHHLCPTAEESAGFHRLPKAAHNDPFDRMLIWQCLHRGWTLITRDRGLSEYEALGLQTVW